MNSKKPQPFVNDINSKGRPGGVYGNVIDEIKKEGICPFCPENLARFHKRPTHRETVHWILTENMYPYDGAKHHLLLIHKAHITSIQEMSKEAWSELKELIEFTEKKFSIPGDSFLLRQGDTRYTGASVSHLHAQIISPDPDDPNYKAVIARVG